MDIEQQVHPMPIGPRQVFPMLALELSLRSSVLGLAQLGNAIC